MPAAPEPEVRLARAADRDRVVTTVVEAFRQEPAFGYFFADPAAYDEQAPALVGHLFDQRLGFDSIWVVDDGAAVSMWNPPGAETADLTEEIAPGVSARTVERVHQYDALVHPLLPREPFWYLGVLATHPDHAGRRWGRLAMEAGLERARADRLPAALETTRDDNVRLYTASGWQVSGAVTVETFQVRVMTTPYALV